MSPSGAPVVFLDANVLFSACLGGEVFTTILELGLAGRVRLVTSGTCLQEARRNLERKAPDRLARLDRLGSLVALLPRRRLPGELLAWAEGIVGSRDAHVLATARAVGAGYLVTGDTRDFGRVLGTEIDTLRVRTPRSFVVELAAS